jgi:hypothetical protein
VKTEFAAATLVMRSQDIGPRTPDEILISFVQGPRVFVVSAKAKAKIDPIPACDKIWRESETKAEKAYSAYSSSDPKDDKLFDKYTQMREAGDAAFHRCFAERVKNEGSFTALIKEAQALINLLPSQ